jgi:uncharacterized protein (DUF2336 family)
MGNMNSTDREAVKHVGINVLDPKQLLKFAQDTTEAGRYQLANAVVQFFDNKSLKEHERHLAGEIMLNRIRQADVDLREALSARLSVQDNIPSEVIVFLAHDTISVAAPILQHSPILNDIDLMHIISAKGEDYWRNIAKRSHLSHIVADRLIEAGDPKTVLNLIDNPRIVLPKHSMKKLVRVALKSEELQAPLLRRPEVESDLAIDLYMCVSNALRQEIVTRFRIPPAAIEAALETLVAELAAEARGTRKVTPEMVSLAKRFKERDEVTIDLLIKTLRRGQSSFFIALFSEKSGFTADTVIRLIQKDGGRPFGLVCRALGMMKSEFASMFLLSRGIRSGDKIVDQRELAMALKYFDALREFDIQRVMRSWVKSPDLI